MNKYARGTILLSLAAVFSTAVFGAAVVGIASTRASMQVDANSVRGTANVTDGSTVRADTAPVRITLQNGARAILAERTAALFFADHIEIREGVGQISGKQGFQLKALTFSASPTTDKSTARISIERPGRILVTAIDSSVKVTKDGVVLAEVPAGTTYFFEENSVPGSGVAPPAAKRAGTAAGKGAAARGKPGLSTGAKWGIVAGGAGAATAIGVYVSHNDVSTSNASR